MSHSFVSLVSHIIFSTKNRRPMLKAEIRDELYAYTGGLLRSEKGRLLKAGGISDHIHLLAQLNATLSVATCVQKIKANTSRWLKRRFRTHSQFAWQEGYAAFSVSPSQIPKVKAYIENQEEHHRKKNFPEELRDLLKAHKLELDKQDLP
jgi:REP element-mobilizing transposase RayT